MRGNLKVERESAKRPQALKWNLTTYIYVSRGAVERGKARAAQNPWDLS